MFTPKNKSLRNAVVKLCLAPVAGSDQVWTASSVTQRYSPSRKKIVLGKAPGSGNAAVTQTAPAIKQALLAPDAIVYGQCPQATTMPTKNEYAQEVAETPPLPVKVTSPTLDTTFKPATFGPELESGEFGNAEIDVLTDSQVNLAATAAERDLLVNGHAAPESHSDLFKPAFGQTGESKAIADWLTLFAENADVNIFLAAGLHSPRYTINVDFPEPGRGAGKLTRRQGHCLPRKGSVDQQNQIFLNPALQGRDSFILALLPQLCHAIDDCRVGRKSQFKKICKAIGLSDGSRPQASPELLVTIGHISDELAPFPQVPVALNGNDQKQTTRMRKIACPSCGYTCRAASKWVARGLPTCPCGTNMLAVAVVEVPTPPITTEDEPSNYLQMSANEGHSVETRAPIGSPSLPLDYAEQDRHFREKTVQFSATFSDVTGRQIHGPRVQDSKLTDAVSTTNEQQVSFSRFASQSYATGTANASRG